MCMASWIEQEKKLFLFKILENNIQLYVFFLQKLPIVYVYHHRLPNA